MIVAPRSDIRLLLPGFDHVADDLFRVAESYVQEGQCVWDLGANLGIFSVAAAWRAGVGGKVYALEADPYYANLIHQTCVRLPKGYAPVTPLCAAVSDSIGLLDLCVPVRGHSRNHLALVSGNSAGATETVKQVSSVTGQVLIKNWPNPDLVKIDIEGAEHLFFRGAPEILKTIRPLFYLEVSDTNSVEITELLLAHDYALFALSSDGKEQPIEKCVFNTLAKPKERSNRGA